MKRINVVPLESVDGVRFGTKRSEVRKQWGSFDEFKKSAFSQNTTDDFGFCHVYYDADDNMEAVEIFDADVYIGDIKVFPVSETEVKGIIDDLDNELISVSKSIGVYAPYGKAECILFGCKGYYDC